MVSGGRGELLLGRALVQREDHVDGVDVEAIAVGAGWRTGARVGIRAEVVGSAQASAELAGGRSGAFRDL